MNRLLMLSSVNDNRSRLNNAAHTHTQTAPETEESSMTRVAFTSAPFPLRTCVGRWGGGSRR